MIAYKVTLEPDTNDTLLVGCPDLPGVNTFGEDRADALKHAVDAIEEWIAGLISDGEDVPRPRHSASKDARGRAGGALKGARGRAGGGGLKRDEVLVEIRPLTALKLELYWALREAGITRAELMRRLGWNRESVDRLFRLDRASRLEQLEAAFRALGRKIDVSIEKAA